MKFIVDTHILLWSLENPNRLSLTQVQAIENPANTILVSAASIAEIAIKCSIGKLQIKGDLLSAISNSGFEILDYTGEEAILLEDLPFHHRDPFDRMIITQAMHRRYHIMTNDSVFASYPCSVLPN